MDNPERYLTDRERLAQLLKDLRSGAGMTGAQAAAAAGMSQAKISKWENAHLLPSPPDSATILDVYRATPDARVEVGELVDRLHADIESNRTHLRRGAAQRQTQIGRIEAAAKELRFFSILGVPGLLQTPAYMRRIFSLDLSGAELVRAIEARQRRQHVLHEADKRFMFVLTEAALRWGFVPAEARAEQVARIASYLGNDYVRIGIIPTGAEVGDVPLHSFQIFDARLVTVGLLHATITVSDPQDIAQYRRHFDTLASGALFGDDSRDLLERLRNDG
ncbi:Scr1 family TA system antitoxin-like transcriptional regulator [Streptodolium elevatio]|uniref:Scr1 family TA system antitoxin-like transcriptional regulator n=1 Tax=Streptodolium elevatio TaxID=3157996 RepID=A0ABV3DK52_9ACTN